MKGTIGNVDTKKKKMGIVIHLAKNGLKERKQYVKMDRKTKYT